ncbi:MAG: DUF547 domain-containing protein [Planctomycetota bacterium]
MNRHIVLTTILTGILLMGLGCEKEQAKVVMPPPVTAAESQQVKPEQAVEQPEPNLPQTPPVEPSPEQPTEVNEPQIQAAPTEPSPVAQLCDKCTQILSTYVDRQGMVDYRSLSRKKLELLDVLDIFRDFDRDRYKSLSKEDKLAFWINAYNLEFIKIILDNYPIESSRVLRLFWPPNSIQHIKGLWDQHKFIIMDEEFTLQEIDDRFFRKEFVDPRVFFAICYGSVSGPTLRNGAYCGQDLSNQLDEQVMSNLASGKVFRIERENQTVLLSAIFKDTWYGRQFVSKYGTDLKFKQQTPEIRAVLNFLTFYLPPQDVDFLETGNYTVKFMGYDWTLNDRSS